MTDTAPTPRQPRFDLGQIVSTPGALEACSPGHMTRCLARHLTGDWGNVDPEDAKANEEALTSAWSKASSAACTFTRMGTSAA